MRLIDADAYPCAKCGSAYCITNCDKYWEWFNTTIDAEPVRHGRWIKRGSYDEDGYFDTHYTCSECGTCVFLTTRYCLCGAKMDLEEEV